MWRIVVLTLCITSSYGQDHPVDIYHRVDCYPEPNANEKFCLQRSCFWDASSIPDELNVPRCYLPQKTGYVVLSKNVNETILIKEQFPPPYENPQNPYGFEGGDIQLIKFSYKMLGSVLNVHFEPRAQVLKRYEPTIEINKNPVTSSDKFVIKTYEEGTFTFSVHRESTGATIFDTRIGGQMFADKYIQLASYLPTDKMYGWGENIHQTLKHDFSKYKTWSMFARDEAPNSSGEDTKNLYGVHPFYLGIENDGRAHGVFFFNSNAQEVTTGPGPHIIYRTVGGLVDIYFFPGPYPEDVIKQYQSFIGKPFLPPYWGLGFQISRYGYKNLTDMQATVARTQANSIPLDVVTADIDYMHSQEDFTVGEGWEGLGDYAANLRNNNLHLIVILDPAIDVTSQSFARAKNQDVSFIEYEKADEVQPEIQSLYPQVNETKIMLAVVWPPNHVAFPDFFDPQSNTADWWNSEVKGLHDQISFDGLWIDMNEPAAFGTNEDYPWYFDDRTHSNITALDCRRLHTDEQLFDAPLFVTSAAYRYGKGSTLASKSLCLSAMTARGAEKLFNNKNLYGTTQARITQKGLQDITQKRSLIISRSTFPSAGRYAGHWLGDNKASWDDLRTTIIGVQEFNLFGIPYIGSDICGFNGRPTEELCLRWQQLGAFHPFSRNHNARDQPDQDPGAWASVAEAAKTANLFRYSYLPYLYSLHFIASKEGGTVIRPVFFEFPKDLGTHDLGYQFMWGSGMMIIPVTESGVYAVSAYLPDSATWYSLREKDYGANVVNGVSLSAATSELIPVLARGGVIIPRQMPQMTTAQTRQSPLELVIPIDYKETAPMAATGRLFWDDGVSIVQDFASYSYCEWKIDFSVSSSVATLSINVVNFSVCKQLAGVPQLKVIDVLGSPFKPDFASVTANSAKVNVDGSSSYDENKRLIHLVLSENVNFVNNDASIKWGKAAEPTTTTPPVGTTTTTRAPATTTTTKATTTTGPSTTTTTTPASEQPTTSDANNIKTSTGLIVTAIAVAIFGH